MVHVGRRQALGRGEPAQRALAGFILRQSPLRQLDQALLILRVKPACSFLPERQ